MTRHSSGIGSSPVPPALQALHETTTSQQSALKEALESVTRDAKNITRRLNVALETVAASKQQDWKSDEDELGLWHPGIPADLNFEVYLIFDVIVISH